MDITKIDNNFKIHSITETDIEWFDASDKMFCLHGLFYCKNEGRFRRLPFEVAKATSEGVANLSMHTAGGRLRFCTNSPYVAIKCFTDAGSVMSHMPILGSHGFSLYTYGVFAGMYAPTIQQYNQAVCNNCDLEFDGLRYVIGNEGAVELYFPLYNGVKKLFIGLKRGSVVFKAEDYKISKPLLFYGSSITQGGCASRPGNDYISFLARKLNFDFINLGFSGCAKAEPAIAEYIAKQKVSVFVLDYDYNAPNADYLKQTHYPLYKKIRDKNPFVPIVLISKPNFFEGGVEDSVVRRAVILQTYNKAKSEGDNNIYFIDGKTLFGSDCRDSCTVDNCHPNDLGFYRMATAIEPVLKEVLKC